MCEIGALKGAGHHYSSRIISFDVLKIVGNHIFRAIIRPTNKFVSRIISLEPFKIVGNAPFSWQITSISCFTTIICCKKRSSTALRASEHLFQRQTIVANHSFEPQNYYQAPKLPPNTTQTHHFRFICSANLRKSRVFVVFYLSSLLSSPKSFSCKSFFRPTISPQTSQLLRNFELFGSIVCLNHSFCVKKLRFLGRKGEFAPQIGAALLFLGDLLRRFG